ncbi:MAG: hypothetical protein JXQ65_08755 [Candidatus Marinimicrobia bacterium]|nr:hypothetical protein [Candidatus Neomarinimicrobiota bacterium]
MTNNNKITTWINKILDETSKLDSTGIEILHACGAECSNLSLFLEGAKKIRDEYSENTELDLLFEAFKIQYYNEPTFTKLGHKITLIFKECTCPLAKNGVKNPFLCHCTVGYTKKIFQTLFRKPVNVVLHESILMGDDHCRQEITIDD